MRILVRTFLHVIAITGLGVVALAQSDADAPKQRDPEVKAKADALKRAVSDRRMSQDQDAIGIIEDLVVKYRAPMHRSDRRTVEMGVAAVFTTGRRREPEMLALYHAAANALGEMGRSGALVLVRIHDGNRFPDRNEWVPLRAILLENVGKTKEEAMVKFLIDEAVRAHQKALMAAAGAALGNFNESRQTIRKEIVNKLLVKWGELDARWREGNIDPQDIEAQTAQEYMAAISDRWNDTLTKLTGAKLRQHPAWQDWWNDNKNTNWDKGKD